MAIVTKKSYYSNTSKFILFYFYSSMWLRNQDDDTKKLYSNPDITFEEVDASVNANVAAKNFRMGNGYGLSKAALCALTLIQAKVSTAREFCQ